MSRTHEAGATSARRRAETAVAPGARPGRRALIVVSGLPRSGTSMVMRMLGAGSVELVTDGVRPSDVGNPHGYFEDERVKRLGEDAAWLVGAVGRAVKIVSPLLRFVPHEIALDLILLRRDIGAVLASQRAVLAASGAGPPPADEDEHLAAIYAEHDVELGRWIGTRRGLRVLELRHGDVLARPENAAERLCAFLGRLLDQRAMALAVDLSLRRQLG